MWWTNSLFSEKSDILVSPFTHFWREQKLPKVFSLNVSPLYSLYVLVRLRPNIGTGYWHHWHGVDVARWALSDLWCRGPFMGDVCEHSRGRDFPILDLDRIHFVSMGNNRAEGGDHQFGGWGCTFLDRVLRSFVLGCLQRRRGDLTVCLARRVR